jgi:Family of unknown function (DUF6502)
MLAGGMPKQAIRSLFVRALSVAEKKSYREAIEVSGGLPLAGLVLGAWHRDRRYLNPKAQPRPVRLLGPAPSVEALIRVESPKKDARQLARRLRSLRILIPAGRGLYRPASEIALVSSYDPLVLQHIAKSLSSLLETIQSNLVGSNASEPLIERLAEVPDLPNECIPAFQQFTKLQGGILLRTVNDWLESRRARKPTPRNTGCARVGLHVHAYVVRSSKQRVTARRLRRPKT